MQLEVLYDTRGQVLALFQAADGPEAAGFEFRPGRGQRRARLELPAELKGLPLGRIHEAVFVRRPKDAPQLACRQR